MKMTFYCFKDSVTNGYSNPFLQLNRAQAIRTAKWKANESKVNEIEDISLVELGEFRQRNGRNVRRRTEAAVQPDRPQGEI